MRQVSKRFDSVSQFAAPETAMRVAEKRIGGMVERYNFALILALFALPIAAQELSPAASVASNFENDPGPGGGGGGSACATCEPDSDGFRAKCIGHPLKTSGTVIWDWGQTGCVAHNSPIGPNGCTFSGYACQYDAGFLRTDPTEAPRTIRTLALLLGDDAASLILDEVAIATLGMAPLEREIQTARLLAERLRVESESRGYGDGYLVIPEKPPVRHTPR